MCNYASKHWRDLPQKRKSLRVCIQSQSASIHHHYYRHRWRRTDGEKNIKLKEEALDLYHLPWLRPIDARYKNARRVPRARFKNQLHSEYILIEYRSGGKVIFYILFFCNFLLIFLIINLLICRLLSPKWTFKIFLRNFLLYLARVLKSFKHCNKSIIY
jgi:hypothetical protein